MKVELLEENGYKSRENLISIEKICKRGFIIALPTFLILVALYYLIYGWYDWSIQPWKDYFVGITIFIVGFLLHELIHALVWAFSSEDKWKSVRFGYDLNYLKPFCNCSEAVTVGRYKLSKLLPLLITGIIPYIIGIITNNFHLSVASAALIGMCGVDIATLIMMRKEKNTSYIVNDYDDSKYGGIIYEK